MTHEWALGVVSFDIVVCSQQLYVFFFFWVVARLGHRSFGRGMGQVAGEKETWEEEGGGPTR